MSLDSIKIRNGDSYAYVLDRLRGHTFRFVTIDGEEFVGDLVNANEDTQDGDVGVLFEEDRSDDKEMYVVPPHKVMRLIPWSDLTEVEYL